MRAILLALVFASLVSASPLHEALEWGLENNPDLRLRQMELRLAQMEHQLVQSNPLAHTPLVVRASAEKVEQAEATLRDGQTRFLRELTEIYLATWRAQQRWALLQEEIHWAYVQFELSRESWRKGEISLNAWLMAQETWARAENQLTQAQRDWLGQESRFRQTLGWEGELSLQLPQLSPPDTLLPFEEIWERAQRVDSGLQSAQRQLDEARKPQQGSPYEQNRRELEAQMAQIRLDQARQRLRSEVADAYNRYLNQVEGAVVEDLAFQRAQIAWRLANHRYERGEISTSEYAKAQWDWAGAQQKQLEVGVELALMYSRVQLLMGERPFWFDDGREYE